MLVFLHSLWYNFSNLRFITLDDCLLCFVPVFTKHGEMWRLQKNLATDRVQTPGPVLYPWNAVPPKMILVQKINIFSLNRSNILYIL